MVTKQHLKEVQAKLDRANEKLRNFENLPDFFILDKEKWSVVQETGGSWEVYQRGVK